MKDDIGNRLDHPELVPAEYRHLIPDDQMRVGTILSVPVSGDVLEVGASDGSIGRRIAERWRVKLLATDIADAVHPWDIRTRFAYQPDKFDAIYCCEVLEHLTDADVELAWTNLLAILKPAGKMILTVPNRDCADIYTAGCRDRWRWPDHRSVWTVQRLCRLLHGAFRRVEWLSKADDIWLMAVGELKR